MTQVVRVPISGALYVTGTVNGMEKVWTQEEAGWWSTTADRSPDGAYRVALSIVYGDGRTTTDSVTLYYGLVLVTDRTEQDVTNGTEKGSYNAADLNRVGAAMAYLRDRFNANGYDIQIDPKTTCLEIDVPIQSDMTLYLGNLGTLKSAITLPAYTPEPPASMEYLTFSKANDIEKILEIIDAMITLMVNGYWYSGELYSGEVM